MDREFEKAKTCAFRLLKFRIRSEQELRDRLKRKKFNDLVIDKVIDFLIQSEFIDDTVFTRQWISSKLNLKPCSRNLLKFQLKQKGVAEAIIEESLSKISKTDELKTARTIAEKRFSKLRALPVNVMKRRLHDYLRRRGFNTSTSIKIINELTNDEQRPD